ncbi:MAG: phosphotransferase [Microbacterium sp.]|uniref:maltokinase N-terminal cap-like domain-containing protein n=1 Tax=Microbacterium sp. TaxID=51671 RepID=UPI001AC86C14|nr:phosphotransferase [Microbacterium sp.]MBN9176033.1 phosphotransferase [Microbacterium sp.]
MSSAHALLELLEEWLPQQRWYSAGPVPPRLRLLADIPLAGQDDARDVDVADAADVGDIAVHVYAVADDAPSRALVYQVPVVVRGGPSTADAVVIGTLPDGRIVTDGPFDSAYTGVLGRAVGIDAEGVRAEVLRGEQSNTSVIYSRPSAAPVICKVYRRLDEGTNPDIELQCTLAAAGSPHVPAAVGSWDGTWTSPDDDGRTASGPLAFAQEFLPGVEDAWRVALRAAAAGESFQDEADALGRATADVHLDLARLFPAPDADPDARAAIAGAWHRRLAIALDEVPALRPHRDRIAARYDAAASAPWPPLQRIHGDYHLGQVLHAPGRGWVLLDFEGEPMRPMSERRAPDLALRDIAGMLRSFDYVAGALVQERAAAGGGADSRAVNAWAAHARAAFLAGYGATAGSEPLGALLDALELDKAVYEAIYEARYRPAWLAIPLRAIERLVGE